VVIEAEDLAELPRVEVDVSRAATVLVRWDCTVARVTGITLRRGEKIHVAITDLGKKRLRKAIAIAEAQEIFVGDSGGLAEHYDPIRAAGLGIMVRRELLKPGSLAAEIHSPEEEEAEEQCAVN